MAESGKVKVWDIGVRVFHWSLVSLFVISYVTGDELDSVHAWSGYAIVALLVFRVVWGFVGSRHARFSDFVYGPAKVKAYVASLTSDQPQHFYGHNPVGGLMVMVLLISLSLSCLTGLEAYGAKGHGPLAQSDMTLIRNAYADDEKDVHEGKNDGDEKFWEGVHEFFVNLTLTLVVMHIAGVFVSGRVHGENLVRPMINGYKDRVE